MPIIRSRYLQTGATCGIRAIAGHPTLPLIALWVNDDIHFVGPYRANVHIKDRNRNAVCKGKGTTPAIYFSNPQHLVFDAYLRDPQIIDLGTMTAQFVTSVPPLPELVLPNSIGTPTDVRAAASLPHQALALAPWEKFPDQGKLVIMQTQASGKSYVVQDFRVPCKGFINNLTANPNNPAQLMALSHLGEWAAIEFDKDCNPTELDNGEGIATFDGIGQIQVLNESKGKLWTDLPIKQDFFQSLVLPAPVFEPKFDPFDL